jgi:tRNA(adenine34) deaminase
MRVHVRIRPYVTSAEVFGSQNEQAQRFLCAVSDRRRECRAIGDSDDASELCFGQVVIEMHEEYMRRAIDIGRRTPNAPFGALLVDAPTGQIVAEGVNRWQENPTWHGEIDAINRCAAERRCITWFRLRLYTTAEPCCMCQGAILWAGIPEVVFGTSIRTLVRLGWNQIDIPAEEVARRTPFAACTLLGGVLEAECDALFQAARRS